MTLQLGYADDYRAWDATEPVTIEARRRVGPPATCGVPVAKRRAVRSAERSPSGGAYAGYELTWHVPVRVLPDGYQIAPGYAVVDGPGRRWTVLTAGLNRLGWTWALGCVDLVLALQLADQVVVERADLSWDAAGAAVKAFPTGTTPAGGRVLYQGVPARVQLTADDVADERGIRAFRGRYQVFVGRPIDVTCEDRVRWLDPDGRTRYLDIVGIHNPDRIDEVLQLDCEARP